MYSHTRSSSTDKLEPHLEPQYEPFLKYDDDLREGFNPYMHPKPDKSRSRILTPIVVAVVTSLIWGAIFYLVNYHTRPYQYSLSSAILNGHNITSNAQLLECGNSTEEAQSRNCQYDLLLNSWVPAPCVDQEWVDEYLDDESWIAYSDEAMTQRLNTTEDIIKMDFYYTSLRDHINHCAVLWKKQFWAFYTERPALDTMISNPRHTDHCATFLSDSRDVDPKEPTKVEKQYSGCWIRK